ncbi:MAG: PDZ domain-containing protein [Gemmatimonadaceae bacterium]
MKGFLTLSAVAAALTATTLQAQTARTRPDSTCTKYSDGRTECRAYRVRLLGDSAWRNTMFMRMDSVMAKRAALGLELRTTGTRRDTLGVFVEAVTPKGPADAAGIIEGDRIAAINGVDLRTPSADTDDAYSNGLASHRLSREVQKLTPGSRVTLRIYSDGRFRDVQVVAGKATDLMRLGNRFNLMIPRGDGMESYPGMIAPGALMPPARMAPMMMQRTEPLMMRRTEPLMVPRAEPLLRNRLEFWTSANTGLSRSAVRELVATAIRDARGALKRLAAAGVV